MPYTPPSSKPRTRTSDLAGFLRGMSTHRAEEAGGAALQIPDTGIRRRKSSLISFLGRSRKKSEASSPVSHAPIENLALDYRHSLADETLESSASARNFGSRITAHLASSSSRSPRKVQRKTIPDATGYTSDSLVRPAKTARTHSLSISPHAPNTPQPTITVSPSPIDDQFDDLFTKPRDRAFSPQKFIARSTSKSESQAFPLSSPPSPTPSTSFHVSPEDQRLDESSSIRSARSSRLFGMEEAPTSGDESEAVSTLSMPVISSTKRRFWDSDQRRFSSVRERKTSLLPLATQPPSLPLPLLPRPTEAPPSPPSGLKPSSRRSSKGSATGRRIRPRSLTLSSSASVPPVPTPRPSSPQTVRNSQERKSNDDKENDVFDIQTASADQLRTALLARTQQLDDLAAYLLKVTQNHVTEKNALEKRIASLERDAGRKDKEIKGLTWLVSNGRSPGPVVAGVLPLSSRSTSSLPIGNKDVPAVVRPHMHGHLQSDDSGGETTSRTVSIDLSGGESPPSPFGNFPSTYSLLKAARQAVRPIPLSDISTNRRRDKRSSVSSFASSVASSSSSLMPSSPTATALTSIPESTPPPSPPTPPTPTAHSLVSNTSCSPSPGLAAKSPLSRDPAIVAAISTQRRDKVQKKSVIKSSSNALVISPAPTPAAAYAANLQKSRPRSIGQTLDLTNPSIASSSK